MNDVTAGIGVGLWAIYAIAIFIIYHKMVVFYFDLGGAIKQSLVASVLGGAILMFLTLMYWKIAVVIILLLGIILAIKASSNTGRVAIIVTAAIFAIVVGVVGYKMKLAEPATATSDQIPIADTYNTSKSRPAASSAPMSTVKPNSDLYLFPSDTVYITESDLYGKTKDEVALIRNEIYARHGYIFKNESYKAYFSAKAWYIPNENFNENMLTPIEKMNKDFIVAYEKRKGWR